MSQRAGIRGPEGKGTGLYCKMSSCPSESAVMSRVRKGQRVFLNVTSMSLGSLTPTREKHYFDCGETKNTDLRLSEGE